MKLDDLPPEILAKLTREEFDQFYSVVSSLVAADILKSVRWYDIDSDDVYREDSIDYIRFRIKSEYDLR